VLRSRLPLGRHLHRLLPRPQPHQPPLGATAAARRAKRELQGDRHRADDGDAAARRPHHRHLGTIIWGWATPPRRRPWACRRRLPRRDLWRFTWQR
jgi:hypothetical protein